MHQINVILKKQLHISTFCKLCDKDLEGKWRITLSTSYAQNHLLTTQSFFWNYRILTVFMSEVLTSVFYQQLIDPELCSCNPTPELPLSNHLWNLTQHVGTHLRSAQTKQGIRFCIFHATHVFSIAGGANMVHYDTVQKLLSNFCMSGKFMVFTYSPFITLHWYCHNDRLMSKKLPSGRIL